MTDIEQERIKEICRVANIDDISDLSDGYHTFKQLYYQRMILFATIVKQNRNKAWKSLRHSDGELCFGGGWFIVGIDTPEGSYTYHYEDYYFSLFDCEELERGKEWDGHTEKDIARLLSLKQEPDSDMINRKAVFEQINNWNSNGEYSYTNATYYLMKRIRDIPSVASQQKRGKWLNGELIPNDITGHWYAECSECGKMRIVDNFCPNCGAKMEVEE